MYALTRKQTAATVVNPAPAKNVWGIILQVLIAALTALTGLLTGCNMAN